MISYLIAQNSGRSMKKPKFYLIENTRFEISHIDESNDLLFVFQTQTVQPSVQFITSTQDRKLIDDSKQIFDGRRTVVTH